MITQTIQLIIASLFWTTPPPSASSECAEFRARAAYLDATWDEIDRWDDAIVLLAMHPDPACAPAERFVLAKRILDEARPNSPIVRILLHQGLRGREVSLVDLVAQVDLLAQMARRNLIHLRADERAHLDWLAKEADALIRARSAGRTAVLFSEYGALARRALMRAARGSCKIRPPER